MNNELLIIDGIILTISIIVIIIIRDREINKNSIKLLISCTNLSIFCMEIKFISNSNCN